METFESIDRALVLWVNSFHTDWLDSVMWFVSGKVTWIPFYLLLAVLFVWKWGMKRGGLFLLGAIIAVILADAVSVNLFKNVFERYRPSHNLLLIDQLHFYEIKPGEFYRGGQFGFVSSHAANFGAICAFAFLTLKKYYTKIGWVMLTVWLLVSFSRMYLGVHYLTDLVAGGIVGFILAYVLYGIFAKFALRINK